MEIGFVGLGAMGRAIARNLVDAGHHKRAWNRSPLGADRLDSVEMVATPGEAFHAEVVVTMLSEDAAIRDVVISRFEGRRFITMFAGANSFLLARSPGRRAS